MRGNMNYSEEKISTCNKKQDFELVNDFGFDFAINASAHKHPNCPGRYHVNSIHGITELLSEMLFINEPYFDT